MKKALILILALVLCISLCACGGRGNLANPDVADDGSANNPGTTSDEVGGNTDAQTEDDAANGDNSEDEQVSEGATSAPESTEDYSYASGDANINISYGDGMTVKESEDGTASVEYGENKLFVKDVTKEYDPNTTDAESFLYDYAYDKCVELVEDTFGAITQFNGEHPLNVTGNELYGYGAHMVCEPQTNVYAFIKLVTLEDGEGYAVMIGVCDENNVSVFDNVKLD